MIDALKTIFFGAICFVVAYFLFDYISPLYKDNMYYMAASFVGGFFLYKIFAVSLVEYLFKGRVWGNVLVLAVCFSVASVIIPNVLERFVHFV